MAKENKDINFETSLKKLDKIASEIEKEALPLDEALKLYEEGLEIVAALEEALQVAKEKVEKIITK